MRIIPGGGGSGAYSGLPNSATDRSVGNQRPTGLSAWNSIEGVVVSEERFGA